MIKITIFEEQPYDNSGLAKVWRIRRENGTCLGEYKKELDALMAAWSLVRKYGLTLVEPW